MSEPYMQAALNVLKYHVQQSHVLLIVTGVYLEEFTAVLGMFYIFIYWHRSYVYYIQFIEMAQWIPSIKSTSQTAVILIIIYPDS